VARRRPNTSAAAIEDDVVESVGAGLALAVRSSRPARIDALVLIVDCPRCALRVLARPGTQEPDACPACDPARGERARRARTQPRVSSKNSFRMAAGR